MRPLTALALLLLALPAAARAPQLAGRDEVWDARLAEHLLSRAGFGATPEEVERAVALGREATVAALLAGGPPHPIGPFATRVRRSGAARELSARPQDEPLDPDERRELRREVRHLDALQVREFLAWWVERMLAGEDPLRERMTLFWHGHLPSSMEDVKDSYEMIEQNRLFRSLALGSFRELLHRVARDPAMLEYLDNDANRRGSPNENFARELMELFTLGEGAYDEEDVKEAARAFTGWTDRDGAFRFERRRHDPGEKTVLGVSGRLDGDDVIEILLARPECPRLLARKLLRYFEGVEPEEERVGTYAELLVEAGWELAPVLERLFLDPAFYRDEVVGARIASPIDFLVGSARRLGARPPARLVVLGAALLGERLFHPPSVKGWDGGAAWITTASLMQRGNLAGVLLGEVSTEDFLEDPDHPEGDPLVSGETMEGAASEPADDPRARRRRALGELRRLRELQRDWRTGVNLTGALARQGAGTDAEVASALADRLLAVGVDATTREGLARVLAAEREEAGLAEGELLERPWDAEPILRRLAHVLLSLPEAQLH